MRYSYGCSRCAHFFDRVMTLEQYVLENSTMLCPKCKKIAKRIYNLNDIIIVYKGSGFTKSTKEVTSE